MPALAVVALVAVYLAVILAGAPTTALGSDGGGKLATAKVMAEGATLDPDVGYWAAEADPAGRFHPLVNTVAVGDRWVQATSLPYSAATAVGWRLAGAVGPALLSVAGGVAAALAARRLAARLGGRPMLAFWAVGLASPLAVYATDTWEHAPALGLALWGVVAVLAPPTWASAAAAGGLFGLALVLRADLGPAVLSLGVALLAVGEIRRRWTARPALAVVGALTGVGVLVANATWERAVLDAGVRDARTVEGAAGAGSEISTRLVDAVVTGAGLFADQSAAGLGLAAVLVAGLAVLGGAAVGARWVSPAMARGAAVAVVALYALRLLDGWSFVPGALAVAPVVVLAPGAPRQPETRVLLGAALGAAPLVWLLAWKGNHLAQWGGRYLLFSTLVLLVLATVTLSGPAAGRWPARLLAGLTVVTAVAGLAWHAVRTDAVATTGEGLDALPTETVVVSTDRHLGRELGADHGERRWLSADPATLADALDVAEAAGAGADIAVVSRLDEDGAAPQPPVGWSVTEGFEVPALGPDLAVQVVVRD